MKLPPERAEAGTNPRRFAGLPVTGIDNVTSPTMTVYPAKGRASGAAMLVFPGGRFEQLAIGLEGERGVRLDIARTRQS